MTLAMAGKIKVPHALWIGIQRLGLSQAEVLRTACLSMAVVRDNLPLSTAEFFALWAGLAKLSQHPAIGLRLATVLDSTEMPPSFMAAYHARDLRDALQRVARFKRLCAPEVVHLHEQDDRCELTIEWTQAHRIPAPPALVDASLASFMELARTSTASSLSAISVELQRPPGNNAVYESYFGCGVRWNAPRDCLVLRRSDLDRSFGSHNAKLLELLVPQLDRQLEQQAHSSTLAEQVCWVLRHRLTAGRPDIRSIASELAMSERTLQRKLTDEGQSFQALLAQTRHELALEHLADSALSLVEVAYMLGYEDQNSFFRAFRQWESCTPSEWRTAHASPIGSHI